MTRFVVCAAVVTAVAAGACAGAGSKRMPTLVERAAIVAALPTDLTGEPVRCTAIDVTVSSDGKWAQATPVYLAQNKGCVRYEANGWFFVRRLASGHWKVVFDGSDAPPCSLHVPKDLANTCRHGP
jgi:hypothetical protein